MNAPLARLDRVTRSYGKVRAVDTLSLEIPEGGIFALLGRNGAGKTTALRMMAGLLRPDAGEVRVFGEDPWRFRPETRRRIGYVSEEKFPFDDLALPQAARLASGLSPSWDQPYLEALQEHHRLPADRAISECSKGEQRMISLALTLAARPDLLILDDPAMGLDASVRRDFLSAVLTLLRQEGKTVLLSSHILGDVERFADRVAFIDGGKLLLSRPVDELKQAVKRLVLHWEDAPPPGEVSIAGAVRQVRRGKEIAVTVDGFREDLPARLEKELGAKVLVHDLPLEEIFIDYYSRPAEAVHA